MKEHSKAIIKRLELIYLDIWTLPAHFLSNEACAKYHLKHVCPRCPAYRQKLRDACGNGKCWWRTNWKKHNYTIPRHFGALNWIKQYLFLKSDLAKFRRIPRRKPYKQNNN